MKLQLLCSLIVTSLIILASSCSGPVALDIEGCLPGKPFILGPNGGNFTVEQWIFSVPPNTLKSPTVFTAKECPEKDFGHKITHQFVGTESGNIVTVEAIHPTDPNYPTIKIEVAATGITADSINLTACQTANPGDDAQQLIVTNHKEALTPKFGMKPTATTKCYTTEFSLAADDGGYTAWFSTLTSVLDKAKTYSGETLSKYMAAVEGFAQEKYEKYISTCYACKQTASYLINKITCSGLIVGDLKKYGCMAAIGAFTVGVGTLFSGVICSGLSWLFDEIQRKMTGVTLVDLCNTLTGQTNFINNAKSEICSLCNTYMPTFNCTVSDVSQATCPVLACKDILDPDACNIDPQGCRTIDNQCYKK